MAITINYASAGAPSSTGLNVLRTDGLKAYFAHYAATFYSPGYPIPPTPPVGTPPAATTLQWFSTMSTTDPTFGGNTYDDFMADYQYAGSATRPASGGNPAQTSIFIAEAKYYANPASSPVAQGQLVYHFASHSLFGELDKIKLGDAINTTPMPSVAANTTYSLTQPVVEIGNLASVLNAGVSGSSVIAWGTGNNDVHNIIYPLMGQHGGYGSTSGLELYLNANDLEHIGTTQNEVFDGFNDNDLFRVNGGDDLINGFDVSEDVVNLSVYGYGSGPAGVAAALADVDYTYSPGDALFENGGHTVLLIGVSSGLTAANISVA